MPVFLALLPQLLAAIPSLIGVFGKGSPQATINQKAAEVVTEAVTAAATAATAATQPLNLQAAVEAIQANPQIAQTVSEAVQSNPAIAALIEVGGGIAEARRANMAVVESPNWWRALLTPAFIVSLLLLAGAAAIIADVLYAHPDNWTSNDRSQALILGISIVSGVMGYYIGSSLGSTRKDDILASR